MNLLEIHHIINTTIINIVSSTDLRETWPSSSCFGTKLGNMRIWCTNMRYLLSFWTQSIALIFNYERFGVWSLRFQANAYSVSCPEIGSSSIDWLQLNTLSPEDGDGIQSSKFFEQNETRSFVMSKNATIVYNYITFKVEKRVYNPGCDSKT